MSYRQYQQLQLQRQDCFMRTTIAATAAEEHKELILSMASQNMKGTVGLNNHYQQGIANFRQRQLFWHRRNFNHGIAMLRKSFRIFMTKWIIFKVDFYSCGDKGISAPLTFHFLLTSSKFIAPQVVLKFVVRHLFSENLSSDVPPNCFESTISWYEV